MADAKIENIVVGDDSMSSLLGRWTIRIVAVVFIGLVSIAGTLIWSWAAKFDRPPVPLTSKLSGPWDEDNQQFNARIKSAFPIGSSEKAMTEELRRQGFSQEDWGGVTGQAHEAVRRQDNIACLVAARVYWRADAAARIVSIKGWFGEEGCL